MNEDFSNGREQEMENRCPRCGSPGIRLGYPDMECLRCGWSEPLIDFPISWDWHRHYCRELGKPDPGPCEAPENDLARLEKRLETLEQMITSFSPEELRQFRMKRVWDEVQDLRRDLHFTQNCLGDALRRKRRPRRPKLTEV